MPSAYSFECDLSFRDAVKRFDAMEHWVRQPNLDGRWLVRDNDRLGDYISFYEFDKADRSIVKSICLYFDTRPRQITLGVKRDPKQPAGDGDLKEARRTLEAYVLEELLPSIGARDVKERDFER